MNFYCVVYEIRILSARIFTDRTSITVPPLGRWNLPEKTGVVSAFDTRKRDAKMSPPSSDFDKAFLNIS